MNKNPKLQNTLALVVIMILATILRLYGVCFGLPYTYHVDELAYVSAALNLGAGNIGLQLNPPVFPNFLFLQYGAYYAVERISGNLSSVADFERLYRTDPSIFFILGRLTSVLMGVLNVLIVYMIGKKASNHLAGILAALFLALSYLHVRDSHFAVPDVMMTFLVTISVLFCLLVVKKANRKYLFLAAFFSGLTIASKWSSWPIVVPLGYVFILEQFIAAEKFKIKRLVLHVGICLICLLAGFFIPAFQLLLKPGSYLAYALTELRSGNSGGFGIWQTDTVSGYVFYLKTLWYGLGAFLLIFGVMGLGRYTWLALATHNRNSVVLILFPLIYYLIMGATRHYFARYALPLIPFLAIFASEMIVFIVVRSQLHWEKFSGALLIAMVLGASAQPLLNSLRFDFLVTQTDTRTIAKEWIEENIAAGTKVAIDWPIHGPALSIEKYDIAFVNGMGLAEHPISFYRQESFDYLITTSFIYDIPTVFEDINIEREDFYNSLDHEAELIKQFYPSSEMNDLPFVFDEIYGPFVSIWERERPGPVLKIYKLSN